MYLVQVLLPLTDNSGVAYPSSAYRAINEALTGKFGGVTAYSRAPAQGRWANAGHIERDEIIIVEVMTEKLDCDWWAEFRQSLEQDLRQKELVIRAQDLIRL